MLQDMNFHRDATSGEEGEALLHANQAARPETCRCLMTAFQSLETAVRLVRAGRQRLHRQALERRQAGRHRQEPVAPA